MDKYTERNKKWLDELYKSTDKQGIYDPHQAIYGFEEARGKPGLIDRYTRIFQVIKALSDIEFTSLLDVGAAEGYTAALVKHLFDCKKVIGSDLSFEACKRASEIFSITSVTSDVHSLPFKDNIFDVVICSETLEHVVDYKRAVFDAVRVAKKAVIISVPHEEKEIIKKNKREKIPNAHIHCFNLESFNFLESFGYKLKKKTMISPYLRIPAALVEVVPMHYSLGEEVKKDRFRFLLRIYHKLLPFLERILGKRTTSALIYLDDFLCRISHSYRGMVFVVLKSAGVEWKGKKSKSISVENIIDFYIPYYYLK